MLVITICLNAGWLGAEMNVESDEYLYYMEISVKIIIFLVLLTLIPSVVLSAICKPPMEYYEGRRGAWLRSNAVEAFVIAEPYPRVLALRQPGEASPLFVDSQEFVGIRTWFLDPIQTDKSPLPARQKGKFTVLTQLHAQIVADPDPITGLQNMLDVSIDSHYPVMAIKHGIRNTNKSNVRVAVWSISSLKREGQLVVPWGNGSEPLRSVTFFLTTSPTDPDIKFGKRGLALDLASPTSRGQMKIGVRSECGWAARVINKTALVIESTYLPNGIYPEGGSNITLYKNGIGTADGWAEIESVGSLQVLKHGQTSWLKETFSLLNILAPSTDTPDAWLEEVEMSLHTFHKTVAERK